MAFSASNNVKKGIQLNYFGLIAGKDILIKERWNYKY